MSLSFSFFYYLTSCTISIALNLFIVIVTFRKSTRGEFKWIFLGNALTNILLSLSLALSMPNVWKSSDRYEFSLITTGNPLLQGSASCSSLFDLIYMRQVHANVLSICIVPLNRFISVCWKSSTMTKWQWIAIVLFIHIYPLIYMGISGLSESTTNDDIQMVYGERLHDLPYEIRQSICALHSNFGKAGDVAVTIGLITCPVISYSITAACVARLTYFVRISQKNIRSSVSPQVIFRQRAILNAISIQAFAPILTYLPLFCVTLLIDNPWEQMDSGHRWTTMNIVHYAITWNPTVDACATILCLKPYRRALCDILLRGDVPVQSIIRQPTTSNLEFRNIYSRNAPRTPDSAVAMDGELKIKTTSSRGIAVDFIPPHYICEEVESAVNLETEDVSRGELTDTRHSC